MLLCGADLYGEERLRSGLQARAGSESGELIRQIIAEMDEFRGDAPEADDVTCLMLDWRGCDVGL